MNVSTQKFQSLYAPVGKSMAWRNHRTTLPQSRPLGVTAPSEREPGTSCTIQRAARKPQDCGRFSSPLRKLRNRFLLPFIGGHSLSHARWACQLPQRGSRDGGCTIQRAARKAGGCGRFSSPLRNSEYFTGFHRGSDTGWGRAPTYGYKLKA